MSSLHFLFSPSSYIQVACFRMLLEAPIPKLVIFQKPFGESEEKSLTLPWNYNSSGSYRPFGASASSSTLSSTTTTTSGSSHQPHGRDEEKELSQLRGCDDRSQVAVQMSMIGGQIHFRGALVQVLSCHHFGLDRLLY